MVLDVRLIDNGRTRKVGDDHQYWLEATGGTTTSTQPVYLQERFSNLRRIFAHYYAYQCGTIEPQDVVEFMRGDVDDNVDAGEACGLMDIHRRLVPGFEQNPPFTLHLDTYIAF